MSDLEETITDTEDTGIKATIDARQQYYRLWLYCSGQIKQAAFAGDLNAQLVGLDNLFNHVYALFNETERKAVDTLLDKARDLQSQLPLSVGPTGAHLIIHNTKVAELKRAMRDAERLIYHYMNEHNMLLPRSTGPVAGWSQEGFLEGSG